MDWRDPLTLARLALAAWVVVVAAALYVRLGDTAAAVSTSIEDATSAEGIDARPAGEGDAVSFEVAQGDSVEAVVQRLADLGLLTDETRARLLFTLSGAASELRAGCYAFERGLPSAEVVQRLRLGLTGEALLAIPEGLRVEEIGALLVDAGVTTEDGWQQVIEQTAAELEAERGIESLNGYLLPASYSACDSTAEQLVAAMRSGFEEQIAPLLEDAESTVGLTAHEVLTLASIVEREAVVREEQPLIAAVFLNRMEEGMPLQADPTVQYAIATPDSVEQYGWWKRELTIDDLASESPYSTYAHRGLPPGPIASPGVDAVRAVLNPADSDALYFVARGDGSHVFARTLDEHNANVAEYLGR